MNIHIKQMENTQLVGMDFRLPKGIVMWSRAFSLLYGLAVELAPGLRPLEVVGPYVVEFLREGE